MGIEDKKDIEIRKLAQTFLASQGEIDKMSHLRDVFYSQKVYDETFRDSYLNSDARKIVLGYKVGLMLNSAMSSIDLRPSTNNQREAVHKARNLVWALLVQAFLNDDKLNDRLESFGTSLKKEPDFRDILEKISISKIWPILKTVLLGSTYAEKIEKSELSFLTSKELYRRCMEEAGNRFQWSKKQI